MCELATIATVTGIVGGLASAGSAVASMVSGSKTPSAAPVSALPQESQAPSVQNVRASAAQNETAGAASTLLTGGQGVEKSSLKLGKNTLLGL